MHDAPRILVVEDEYLIALELDTQLWTAGYRVIGPVPDIDGALEVLKADRPDAAIIDVNFAGEWVTPVAETLRAMCVPFILASGYVAADLQDQPVLRDAVNVGKSWRLEFLLNTLRSTLDGMMWTSPLGLRLLRERHLGSATSLRVKLRPDGVRDRHRPTFRDADLRKRISW